MPQPKEICLEDLDLSPEDERYIRCVALPGGEPGLALDREGTVRWMPDGPCAYGLWVSADDRLVLLREAGAAPITVLRGGRSQAAPVDKPVILLDGDHLQLEGRRYQVHVHGQTELVYPPEPTSRSALAKAARAATAALALGAVVGGTGVTTAAAGPAVVGDGAQPPIEVRSHPPAPPAMRHVDCKITKQSTSKPGRLVLHATCPKNHRIPLGARGRILDPKDRIPIKDGTVRVKSVKKDKLVVEAVALKKPTKAKVVQFYVRFR